MEHRPAKKVILLIDSASEFDRKMLRGIVEYSREHGPWQFYRMPTWTLWNHPDGESRLREWARKWNADAIIGRWTPTKEPKLTSLGIPIVLQNYHSRSKAYSVITGDYVGTGRMAADFFLRRGSRNFAFYGISQVVWSEERLQGYSQVLGEAGFEPDVFELDAPENEARDRIARWLKDLPKPVALFACDDAHALTVSEICRVEGIKIPEEISLLGVDNDELLCEISDPPISSIALDVEQGGWTLCSILDTEPKEPFTVVIRPTGIVERNSTKFHNIRDALVEKVVLYIEENYAQDLTMEDITGRLPLSRRSIETRFRKEMGTTIWQYLLSVRIGHFSQLLLTTELPLKEIALECGFRDPNNIARTFRKFKGVSPQEYRRR